MTDSASTAGSEGAAASNSTDESNDTATAGGPPATGSPVDAGPPAHSGAAEGVVAEAGGPSATGDAAAIQTPSRADTLRAIGGSWRLWGWVSVAMLVASFVVWVGTPREPEPVAHVREYLTAIQEKRVVDALKLAGERTIPKPQDRFLTPKALDGNWEIAALDGYDVSAQTDDTEVDVALRAGKLTTTFELRLVRSGDTWRIVNAFQRVVFSATGMLYVDVNGEKAAMERSAVTSETYALFPGLYRFYSDIPGIAKIRSEPMLLGADDPYSYDDPEPGKLKPTGLTVTLTSKGKRKASKAVRAHIDDCVARTELAAVGCPFGAMSGYGPEAPGRPRGSVKNPRKISWKVTKYPKLAFVDDSGVIRVSNRTPGVITVKLTGDDADTGRTITYSATCSARLNSYSLLITKDAEFIVVRPGERYGRKDSDGKPVERRLTETCGRYALA